MGNVDYLKDEMKRLNRINDMLEKEIYKSGNIIYLEPEIIVTVRNNALAICEIAKNR